MRAEYKKRIRGYTALSRFLSDVPESSITVDREYISGLPSGEYSYSKTVEIESKPDYNFVRIESSHAVYSIYKIL